jgi:probable HAF family extracellular repeat protein
MTLPSAVHGLAWFGFAACLACGPHDAVAQTSFKLRMVPPLMDLQNYTVSTFANSINRNGLMASGLYQQLGGGTSFRCDKSSCVDIPALGSQHHSSTSAEAINDDGLVVGSSPYQYFTRGYLFDGSTSKNLGAFPEGFCQGCDLSSLAHDINNLGQVVGTAETDAGPYRAFIWHSGTMTKLGTLGGDSSEARGINDQGDVVGESTMADGATHAFLLRRGHMKDLGTLGGRWAAAYAINAQRLVVGCSTMAGEAQTVAFLHDGTGMKALPTLGGSYACASDLNAGGWIVGSALIAGDAEWHGFLYDGTQMIDLNDTLPDEVRARWTITFASGINRRGQVAAMGTHKATGSERALLLTPVVP